MIAKIFIGVVTLVWYLFHIPTYVRVRKLVAQGRKYGIVNSENGHHPSIKTFTTEKGAR